jgi:hypothetical protein
MKSCRIGFRPQRKTLFHVLLHVNGGGFLGPKAVCVVDCPRSGGELDNFFFLKFFLPPTGE